jgi:poly(hydroxyalkanoate) depolymerase family esterase
MSGPFKIDMKEATGLTRLGKLNEAVGLIMSGLQGKVRAPSRRPSDRHAFEAGPSSDAAAFRPIDFSDIESLFKPKTWPASTPSDDRFTQHVFSGPAGSRPYKLYVPAARPQAAALIVMLHGCTQSPDDFAAGTRMNVLAEAHGFLVVYPAQPKSANASKCWNWFNAAEQQRDQGEPSLIAGITREVMRNHKVDPRRVYIAGLSAGGAAAAIMAETYPDLYAAAGIHSGLACGAAHDMMSAFAAMKQGPKSVARPKRTSGRVPLIVFQGDTDKTVHPSNAAWIVESADPPSGTVIKEANGRSAGGVDYTRTTYLDPDGKALVENWTVHGGGHAWFGGSPAGSYTDPAGPDASGEMVRFFLEHGKA